MRRKGSFKTDSLVALIRLCTGQLIGYCAHVQRTQVPESVVVFAVTNLVFLSATRYKLTVHPWIKLKYKGAKQIRSWRCFACAPNRFSGIHGNKLC